MTRFNPSRPADRRHCVLSRAASGCGESKTTRLVRLLPALVFTFWSALPTSRAIGSEVDAAGYYELRCASCHGLNGEGTRDKSPSLGPPLRGNPLIVNAPAELLAQIIRHGRSGQQRVYDDAYPNMPAFDAGMVPDAIGLATYLKTVLQEQSATSPRRQRREK